MSDPLGRNHQIKRRPTNRDSVNNVCDYVLDCERENFNKNPSAKHVYYDAFLVIYGTDEATKMLAKARDEKNER